MATPAIVVPGPGKRAHSSYNRTKSVILQRRAKVAALFLLRMTEWDIAKTLGVSHSVVSYDLRALQIQWYDEAMRDIGEHKSRLIAELDAIIGECTAHLHEKNRDKTLDSVWISQWRTTLLEKAKVLGLMQNRVDLPNDGRTITVREVVIETPQEPKQLGPVIDV